MRYFRRSIAVVLNLFAWSRCSPKLMIIRATIVLKIEMCPVRHQASHMRQISLVGAPVVNGNEMVNPLPEKMTFLLAQVHFV